MTDNEADAQPVAKILVIDDEEVLHVSLKRTLGRQGHEVKAVFTAAEGLQLVEEEDFDLVITDLMMPELDGIGLLKQLQEKRNSVPVLMITGYPTIRTALQALRLGAVDYLAKPFTREELLGPVNRTLRRTAEPLHGQPTRELLMVAAEKADGIESPDVDLTPGDRFTLPGHSWAVFQQDGAMTVGIEQSFLQNVGQIEAIDLPHEAEVVEQGYVGFRLRTGTSEAHNVFMPITGPVVAVNEQAEEKPSSIDQETWLVRIIPSQLEKELEVLLKRD